MSPKNSLLSVGLTALWVFGFAAVSAARADDAPAPPGLIPAPASAPAPEAAPSSAQPTAVLLMSNGRLIQGPITREGEEYVLRQRGGMIRFPASQVEEVFRSVAEVYRYKADQIPDRDPDEHLKLARWCLAQGMKAEVRKELNLVLAVSPDAREAKAMLAMLDAESARLASSGRVDPGVVQTAGVPETPQPPMDAGERPGELDSNLLRTARKELGVTGLPVIFDLPPALAVKRADQFARVVHPVLQAACARCHNEKHEGDFRLVEIKSRRDWTPNAFRANLDATLQLIDPNNPSKSELLSSTLLPHGNGTQRRPIFRGSNDPRFQIISAWVNSLGVKPTAEAASGTRFRGREEGGGFASERGGAGVTGAAGTSNPADSALRQAAGFGGATPYDLGPPGSLPLTKFVPGKGAVVEQQPPSAADFPVPFSVSGQKPVMPAPAQTAGVPGPAPTTAPLPTPVPVPTPAPAADPALPAPAPPGEGAKPEASAKPKKSLKLDPALLERAIKLRNGR